MKSKRTKATDISQKVREEVERRDNHCCIFCGSPNARGEGHYIRRSQGGLGIPQNLVTVCRNCHREFDEGQYKEVFKEKAKEYLRSFYPDWNEEDLVYHKYQEFNT
jgi:5-methylcytosine-specific restriction endonuclease McrA